MLENHFFHTYNTQTVLFNFIFEVQITISLKHYTPKIFHLLLVVCIARDG